MDQTKNIVNIWTDGGCSGNPGYGAIGIVMQYGGHEKHINAYVDYTTNNQMELMAAIVALSSLTTKCNVCLWTDSKYLLDGITKWIISWKKNSWRTADKKPVKNIKLWQVLDDLMQKHDVELKWLKGHAGHQGNEQADFLCNDAMSKKSPLLGEGFLQLLK